MANNFVDIKKELPYLGIGLGLRRDLADETFEHSDKIDWLELVPENYMGLGGSARERLEKALSRFPLISHGVSLSVGSTDSLDLDFVNGIKGLIDKTGIAWWSDHLCFSGATGVQLHDLLPLPFSKEAVKHCVTRIKKIQSLVETPFLIENISYYMDLPGREMNEAQFLAEVLELADCGLLLDVNNVYVNSLNFGFDPKQFLDSLPLERTVQIHVAGHKKTKDKVIDTHGAAVIQPVYDLLDYAVERAQPKAVMLERDQNFPDFEDILEELAIIRRIVESKVNGDSHHRVKEASNAGTCPA